MARKLKVAFWNLRNLFEPGVTKRGPTTPAELESKLQSIERVLRRIGPPDVMALAEVGTRRLAEEVGRRVYGRRSNWRLAMELAADPRSTGIAILGSSKVVEIRIAAVDRGAGAGRPRALWADVELAGKLEVLRFAACHWKSDLPRGPMTPSQDRSLSARWLEARVSAAGRAAPVLVLGDLNAEPFAPELIRSLKSCRHYSSTARGRLFAATWHWLAEPDDYDATKGGGYAVSRPRGTISGSPPRILDHVLVSRALLDGAPFKLVQSSVRVHLDADTSVLRQTGHIEPRKEISDHFPVVLELGY